MDDSEAHLLIAVQKDELPSQPDNIAAPLLERPDWLTTQTIADALYENHNQAANTAPRKKKSPKFIPSISPYYKGARMRFKATKKAKKAKKPREDEEKAEEDTPAGVDAHTSPALAPAPAPAPAPRLDFVWNYDWASLEPVLVHPPKLAEPE